MNNCGIVIYKSADHIGDDFGGGQSLEVLRYRGKIHQSKTLLPMMIVQGSQSFMESACQVQVGLIILAESVFASSCPAEKFLS